MNILATGTKPKIVSGTENLIADATKWIMGGLTAIVVLAILISGVKWFFAEEEERPRHVKSIKRFFIMGVFLLLVDVLVAFVFSYYK